MVYLRNTIHVAWSHTQGLAKSLIKVTEKEKSELKHNIFRTPGDDDALWHLTLAQ